jgi:hypothetical protein
LPLLQSFNLKISSVWSLFSWVISVMCVHWWNFVKFDLGHRISTLYKCFLWRKSHKFIIFWRKTNSEASKSYEVAKIIKGIQLFLLSCVVCNQIWLN